MKKQNEQKRKKKKKKKQVRRRCKMTRKGEKRVVNEVKIINKDEKEPKKCERYLTY